MEIVHGMDQLDVEMGMEKEEMEEMEMEGDLEVVMVVEVVMEGVEREVQMMRKTKNLERKLQRDQ